MSTFVRFLTERFTVSRVIISMQTTARGSAMPGKQLNFPSEGVMADVCLGLAVAGVNTLVALGVCIAFM
jgi:hypothetical protein